MDDNPRATDPFLASLDKVESESDPWRAQVIGQLYVYHYIEPKTAFCAVSTMALAEQIGLAPPQWAVKLVVKTIHDYVREGRSLDIAFGLKGDGTGKTRGAEVRQQFRKNLYESLCWRVHRLVVAGTSKTEAYRQVAQQVKALAKLDARLNTTPWYNSTYKIKPPNEDTLGDYYVEFEKNLRRIDEILQEVSPQKDIENFEHLVNRFIDLLTEPTTLAMKRFFDCLKPSPPSQP